MFRGFRKQQSQWNLITGLVLLYIFIIFIYVKFGGVSIHDCDINFPVETYFLFNVD